MRAGTVGTQRSTSFIGRDLSGEGLGLSEEAAPRLQASPPRRDSFLPVDFVPSGLEEVLSKTPAATRVS